MYMYRKVSLSSFCNGKVDYCTTSGSGDIKENASPVFFYSDFIYVHTVGKLSYIWNIVFQNEIKLEMMLKWFSSEYWNACIQPVL